VPLDVVKACDEHGAELCAADRVSGLGVVKPAEGCSARTRSIDSCNWVRMSDMVADWCKSTDGKAVGAKRKGAGARCESNRVDAE
jgi:hypothetical protein